MNYNFKKINEVFLRDPSSQNNEEKSISELATDLAKDEKSKNLEQLSDEDEASEHSFVSNVGNGRIFYLLSKILSLFCALTAFLIKGIFNIAFKLLMSLFHLNLLLNIFKKFSPALAKRIQNSSLWCLRKIDGCLFFLSQFWND